MNVTAKDDAASRRELIWLEQIAQSQDKRAMQSLYEAYRSRIIPFLLRMTKDQGMIEEIYNDVMMTVWKKAAQFKGDAKVSSWIFSIAYRACLKLLKKQKVRQVLFETFSKNIHEENELEEHQSDHSELEAAMKSLPAKQRLVIELSYFQGHSIEEISSIANCPVNTVKTRLHHARNKIREEMNQIV
ncbi:RNA polymerase sigma factor [Alteromonas sp. 5E99-2]|uniref:RNA polymerase sigma factor n=1 Tax=Alteromonas sp. 5E99-2 TaxID=2817683 RepID=UPI001A995423|nr:RNA polymerase sigma factor [Alteromonas sp. 5E99-2]MBO1255942.1 RNA polymerase sigma factor [Alteromonas sp. 5E99-2]